MNAFRGFCSDPENGGMEISSTGEEEVKVAKSEASALTGAWCKKELPRPRAE